MRRASSTRSPRSACSSRSASTTTPAISRRSTGCCARAGFTCTTPSRGRRSASDEALPQAAAGIQGADALHFPGRRTRPHRHVDRRSGARAASRSTTSRAGASTTSAPAGSGTSGSMPTAPRRRRGRAAKTRLWLLYLAGCSLAFERSAVGIFQTLASKRTRGAVGPAADAGRLYRIAAELPGYHDDPRADAYPS